MIMVVAGREMVVWHCHLDATDNIISTSGKLWYLDIREEAENQADASVASSAKQQGADPHSREQGPALQLKVGYTYSL